MGRFATSMSIVGGIVLCACNLMKYAMMKNSWNLWWMLVWFALSVYYVYSLTDK